jgi:hypothetical protein
MTTTTMTFAAAASAAAQKKKTQQPTQRWRWSGGEEPNEHRYRDDDDEDTGRLTAHEILRIQWYSAQSRIQWRDDDVTPARVPTTAADDKTIPHVPFMNLTKHERHKKSDQFKFGLCSHCDAGLGDESDFVCVPKPNGAFIMKCNACHDYDYYLQLNYHPGATSGCN